MSTAAINVAVVGAHASVGNVLLELLAERAFPVAQLSALGYASAIGRRVQFGGRNLSVSDASVFDFSRVRLVFLVAGPAEQLSQLAESACKAGCYVIDAAGVFAGRPDMASVVPEVNCELLDAMGQSGVVSQPGAASIHLACVLAPIKQAVGLARVSVASYHAVSEDEAGVARLADQTARLLNGRAIESDTAGRPQSAFNAVPLIGKLDAEGHSRVERDMQIQMRDLLSDPQLLVSVTAVQVPVFFGHSQAVHLETIDPISTDDLRRLLQESPGIQVVDERLPAEYATAVGDAAAQDGVYVSRIRADLSVARGIDLWIVADNQRKGGVLNALQIAELIMAKPRSA